MVYVAPRITAAVIKQLFSGDMVTVVSSSGNYFGFLIANTSSKSNVFWIEKKNVKLYNKSKAVRKIETRVKKSVPRQVYLRTKYSKPTIKKTESKQSLNKKNNHNFELGLSYVGDAKSFGDTLYAFHGLYSKTFKNNFLWQGSVMFAYNDLFKSLELNLGSGHIFYKKNKNKFQNLLSLGGEKLFSGELNIYAVNVSASFFEYEYRVSDDLSVIFKPIQIKSMVYNDQDIALNFRYLVSFGVRF